MLSLCSAVIASATNQGGYVEGAFIFRTYDRFSDQNKHYPRNPGEASTVPIWAVARATSAAPTYFDMVEIDGQTFTDGGFRYGNPSLEAFFEVQQMYHRYQRVSKNAIDTKRSSLKLEPAERAYAEVDISPAEWPDATKKA